MSIDFYYGDKSAGKQGNLMSEARDPATVYQCRTGHGGNAVDCGGHTEWCVVSVNPIRALEHSSIQRCRHPALSRGAQQCELRNLNAN